MRNGNLKEAPDFTNAALVMAGINLLWILVAIWMAFGFRAALGAGYALDRLILWRAARRRSG